MLQGSQLQDYILELLHSDSSLPWKHLREKFLCKIPIVVQVFLGLRPGSFNDIRTLQVSGMNITPSLILASFTKATPWKPLTRKVQVEL
jgi:hypothetical protein